MNIMNANEWILCPSKRMAGRFYYFNSQTGQSIWTTDDLERRPQNAIKPNFTPNPFTKWHNYPEPTSPEGPGPNNWLYQDNHCTNYRPYDNPVFGQPAFFKPFMPWGQQPELKRPNEPTNWYRSFGMNTPQAKPKEMVFGERYLWKDDCECSCKKRQKETPFSSNAMFRQENPWHNQQTVFRNDNTAFGGSRFGKSLFRKRSNSLTENLFVNRNSNRSMSRTQSLEELSFSLANDVEALKVIEKSPVNPMSKKPVSNARSVSVGSRYSDDSEMETVDLRYLLERKRKSGGVGACQAKKVRTSIPETSGENKDLHAKKRVTFNLTNDEDDDHYYDYDDLERNYHDNDDFDNLGDKTSVTDNIGRLDICQNDFDNDVQRRDDEGNDATLDADGEYGDENFEIDATRTINVLANLATADHNQDHWLLVVDIEGLLADFEFLEEFVKQDPTCSVLVPSSVHQQATRRAAFIPPNSSIPPTSFAAAARTLVRILQAPPAWITVQKSDKEIQSGLPIEDSIVNCCLEMAQNNYHVILLTDNEKLSTKAKNAGIYSFKLQEVKKREAEFKTEVTFDLVKIPSDLNRHSLNDKPKAHCDNRKERIKNDNNVFSREKTCNTHANSQLFRDNHSGQLRDQKISTQNLRQTQNVQSHKKALDESQNQQSVGEKQCNTCSSRNFIQRQTQNLSPRSQNSQTRVQYAQNAPLQSTLNNRYQNLSKQMQNGGQKVTERKNQDNVRTEIENQQKLQQESSKSVNTSRRIKLTRSYSLNPNLLTNNEENTRETQNGGQNQQEPEVAISESHSPVLVFKKKQSNTPRTANAKRNTDENINCYNLKEHLKKFVVTSKVMEERITNRIEGHMCFLKQVTETTLTDFLEVGPSPLFARPHPWSVSDSLSCLKQSCGDNPTVAALVDRLIHHWNYYEDLKHKTLMLPSEFLTMFGCTVLLIKVLKALFPVSPPLQEALPALQSVYSSLSADSEDEVSPSSAAHSHHDTQNTQHVTKDSDYIISYLKQHYPEWKNHYDELKEGDAPPNANETANVALQRGSPNNAPKTTKVTGQQQTKESGAKLIKNLALNSLNIQPKMKKIDVEKREKDNVVLTNMLSDILGKKMDIKTTERLNRPIEVNVLVKEHVESSHDQYDLDALDYTEMLDDSDGVESSGDDYFDVNTNSDSSETVEHYPKNLKKRSNNLEQSSKNLEQSVKKLVQYPKNLEQSSKILEQNPKNLEQSSKNLEQIPKDVEQNTDFNNRQRIFEYNKAILKIDDELHNLIEHCDQNSDDTGNLVIVTDDEAKVTSTDLVPISNVDMSRQTYAMIKMFLMEMTAALKVCHAFISSTVLVSNRPPASHRRALRHRLERARVHMDEIMHGLKKIMDRETPRDTPLKAILYANNNNCLYNDNRITWYRQVVSKYFEQVQLMDDIYRNLLGTSADNGRLNAIQ